MTYQFYGKSNYTLHTLERQGCIKTAYYSKQKMDELYPDGGYEVIGEIGNFAKKYAGQDVILTDTGKFIPIFPRGSLKKPFEWVAGYVAVEENTYVAVVKSIIQRLIYIQEETFLKSKLFLHNLSVLVLMFKKRKKSK